MGRAGPYVGEGIIREGEACAERAAALDSSASELTTASMGLWPWVRVATRGGMSIQEFCDLIDIEVSELRDLGRRFSQPVANRAAELAFARFGRGAAMEAALTLEPGHFALLELIARSAANVGAGLEQGCRFFALLHDGGRLSFERLAEGAIALRWRPRTNIDVHPGYVELTFAVAVIGVRRETEQDALAPVHVHYRHPAPADAGAQTSLFGVAPRFGMDMDEIVFERRVALLPLTRGNPAVHAAAVKSGSELIDD